MWATTITESIALAYQLHFKLQVLICNVNSRRSSKGNWDDKSLCVFNTIGLATNHDSDILIRNIGLSRKQSYMRVSKMIEVGLVVRYGRRYNLTTLGKIVYHVQLVIGNALKDHWKLKALDVLNVSESSIPVAEHKKIVDSIIDNEKIKEMILVRRAWWHL